MAAGTNPNPGAGSGSGNSDEEAAKAAVLEKKKAADQAIADAAAAAKATQKVVLVRAVMRGMEELPRGTELDADDEWVKRALAPHDLVVTREVYDAEEKLADAKRKAEAAREKALQGK